MSENKFGVANINIVLMNSDGIKKELRMRAYITDSHEGGLLGRTPPRFEIDLDNAAFILRSVIKGGVLSLKKEERYVDISQVLDEVVDGSYSVRSNLGDLGVILKFLDREV